MDREILAGRYELRRCVGAGGMGSVWQAWDELARQIVAVKVLAPDVVGSGAARERFDREITAVARLSHPNIVPLLDRGVTDEGTPYFVMAYLEGRPLREVASSLPWAELRGVLDDVLAALAYAHARGIVHHDIKPANIVVSPAGSATVVDFGVASLADDVDDALTGLREPRPTARPARSSAPPPRGVVGTIAFMAPEQLDPTLYGVGPHTDLYAFGVMLHALVLGAPPFKVRGIAGALEARRERPELPEDGEDGAAAVARLLNQLLRFEPWRRARVAADVRRALARVEVSPSGLALIGGPTEPRAEPPVPAEDRTSRADPPSEALASPRRASPRARDGRDRNASRFRLFGLRDPPLHGRSHEREHLFAELRAVAASGAPRLVVLEGPAGVGKSRLARGLLERGVEAGVCRALRTSWSEEHAGLGLAGLVERELGSSGLPALELERRVRWLLEGSDRSAPVDLVTEARAWLRPLPGVPRDAELGLRVASAVIEILAARGPVALVLDDVEHARGQALALWRRLARAPLPILVVATSRRAPEDLPSSEVAGMLEIGEATSALQLGALDDRDIAAILDAHLPLEPELARLLAARSGESPLVATQLLSTLVGAGLLEESPRGFKLVGGASEADVPSHAAEVWRSRVAQAIPAGEQRGLHALAMLAARLEVDLVEALHEVVPELRPALGRALAAGLVVEDDRTYRFAHQLLRAHLVAAAPAEDRPALHAACARALELGGAARPSGSADRLDALAVHVRATGDALRAADLLFLAAERALDLSSFDAAGERATRLEGWARARGEHAPGGAWCLARVALVRGGIACSRGDLVSALGFLEAAEPVLRGSPGAVASEHALAASRIAEALAYLGKRDEALAWAARAVDGAEGSADVEAIARARHVRQTVLRRFGRWAESLEEAAKARRALVDVANPLGLLARIAHDEAVVRYQLGQIGRATRAAEEALELSSRVGAGRLRASIVTLTGDLARQRGDHAAAREAYERALRLAQHLEIAHYVTVCLLNLALNAVELGDYEKARRHADDADEAARAQRLDWARTGAAYLLCEVEARAGDAARAREALARAKARWADAPWYEKDLVDALTRAATFARDPDLQRELLEEARRLEAAMGTGRDEP